MKTRVSIGPRRGSIRVVPPFKPSCSRTYSFYVGLGHPKIRLGIEVNNPARSTLCLMVAQRCLIIDPCFVRLDNRFCKLGPRPSLFEKLNDSLAYV